MARASKKLSAVQVKNLNKPGRHADGEGLYLKITQTGTKSWMFIWMAQRKRREMGLGPYPLVSLAEAREKADRCRRIVAGGGDPVADRDAKGTVEEEAVITFGECADQFLSTMEHSWRNEKHRDQWYYTLSRKRDKEGNLVKDGFCLSIISVPVNDVSTEHVLKILTPIWQSKAETASRLRGRIERVLDYAKVRGWREGENPALWRGHLRNALPARQKLQRGHHAAMPFTELPEFMPRLRASVGIAPRAMEFLILTAARTGEVLGARWEEFDLEEKVWTVPANRMKAGKTHRVPLSDRAAEIISEMKEAIAGDYVFPGAKGSNPLSNMAFTMLLRRLEKGHYTTHGRYGRKLVMPDQTAT